MRKMDLDEEAYCRGGKELDSKAKRQVIFYQDCHIVNVRPFSFNQPLHSL
jgi:hypothetical protein